MLDSGATASAGPESSAKLLLFKLREIDPEIGVHMDFDRTPYFRYGSGQWGKARCQLTITSSKNPLRSFQMYTLLDPPGYVYGWSSSNMLVPILVWTSVQKLALFWIFRMVMLYMVRNLMLSPIT